MSTDTISLPDIPDLTSLSEEAPPADPFTDGWYKGVILEKRVFSDRNGNDRVFESSDNPSAAGNSRNIKLQVQITRQSDGRNLNVSHLINYRPEDLTPASISAVKTHQEQVKEGVTEWGPLFRTFATLQNLGVLQRVAGVRQLQKNGNGGLDLSVVYNKEAYFRLKDDDRNPQYKMIAQIRPLESKPKQIL